MSTGGIFALETIPHFNGNLFDAAEILELTADDIEHLHDAAKLDWSAVDPSIFGTLFERGMDPTKRSQLGAHYTSREDIETLVEPVIMQPLRRRWEETRASVPGSLDGPWSHLVHEADAHGVGIVRYPRIIPKDDQCAQKLQARTLTNLYNQRPAWLDLAHRRLDHAVFDAYGWPPDTKTRLFNGCWN